jgi:hypothetical protein
MAATKPNEVAESLPKQKVQLALLEQAKEK